MVPSERPASTGVYMSQWETKFHELVVSNIGHLCRDVISNNVAF